MLNETRPQAIYRAELSGVMMQSAIIGFGFLVVVTYVLSSFFPLFDAFLAATAGNLPYMYFMARRAERLALLRCQRGGMLGYIRTQEVVHRKPIASVPETTFRCQSRIFSLHNPWCHVLVFPSLILALNWNSLPVFVPLIPGLIERFVLVGFLSCLLFLAGRRLKIRWFQVDRSGVTRLFRRVPWEQIDRCVITRDYGSAGATDEMPCLSARFYGGRRWPLLTIWLMPYHAESPQDYVRLEETIYAHMGGRDPLPSTQTAAPYGV